MSFKEITIKVKGDEQQYRKKFACYEDDIALSDADPTLQRFVRETPSELKEPIEGAEVELMIKMQWQ